jgi:hypothetical protein
MEATRRGVWCGTAGTAKQFRGNSNKGAWVLGLWENVKKSVIVRPFLFDIYLTF